MTNIFDGKICSYYKNILDFNGKKLIHPSINRPILDILTKEGYTNTAQLNKIRLLPYGSDQYSNEKKHLSAASFSTVQDDLTISRSDKNTLFHTGFITVDIDVEKNPVLSQPGMGDEMKEYIINDIPFVAYLGRSVSNLGMWALIPIAYKDEHYAHFRAINKYFDDRGIYMDAPLSDISRLRFVAYDPDAHIVLNPQVFTDTLDTKESIFQTGYTRKDVTVESDEFFLAACKWIEMKHGIKFEKGYIHNYLLRLYAMLRYAQVSREIILQWIYKNLIPKEQVTTNCLDEIEVKSGK